MVIRKPVPENQSSLVPAPLSQAMDNPPYPTTPSSEQPPVLPSTSSTHDGVYSPNLHESPAFNLKPLVGTQHRKQEDEDESVYDSDSSWDRSDDEERTPDDIPGPLKIGAGKPIKPVGSALPDALRAGPPAGVPVRKSVEEIKPDITGATSSSFGAASVSSQGSIPLQTNNPYLRMQNTGQSSFGAESSAQVWGEAPSAAQKYGELVELPAMNTPIEAVSKMSLEGNTPVQREEQPPLIAVQSPSPATPHPRQDSNASSVWEPGMDISSLDAFSRSYGLPTEGPIAEEPSQRTWQEQQAWEKSERERRQQDLAAASEAAAREEQERRHEEEWHRGEQAAQANFQVPPSVPPPEVPPQLPPRRSHEEEVAPPKPPRPQVDASVGGSSHRPAVMSPNTVQKKRTTEHYQIKHIRWYDAQKPGVRESPILTQNINGPCPLLALVNALVLSTPASEETALVETLRTREQVSLGLLLDAVFDELTSGRRGGAAVALPDVGELYSFLITLHTGMNINPMFVDGPEATDGVSELLPGLTAKPGRFENTREMGLYSTFNLPLVHGWLPPKDSAAYAAFNRVAKTYEDSQHIQFAEEELEQKLNSGGLNEDEQRLFEDVHAIKEFLNRWPTQLSDYGLRTMKQSLQPGQIGILFRNDHFSTLYKEPRTERIMTLVTDAGYSTHDEIVWESLVDVTGQNSELFSGDFRPVGNNNPAPSSSENPQNVQSMLDVDDDQGWTTVQSGRRRDNQALTSQSNLPSTNTTAEPAPADRTRTEQEDHDLALALQLQEEEEDRHRRELEERRRRENRLSEEAIAANQNRGNRRSSGIRGENPPTIPPRRNNVTTSRPVNPNEPVPPPTYEEAATTRPYHPPQGHPANPNAPIRPAGSAYQANSAGLPQQPVSPGGRRNPRPPMNQPPYGSGVGRGGRRASAGVTGPGGVGSEERDKCVVM